MKKLVRLILLTVYILSFLIACKKEVNDEFYQSNVTDSLLNNTVKSGYILNVNPSVSTLNVGGCLYFNGTITNNGSPVSNVQVGVDDPIRQFCTMAGTTNYLGKFTYYVENYCPAQWNNKYGNFQFKFYVGNVTKTCNVMVNLVPPKGYREVFVKNTSSTFYKVQVVVNGINKGTFTVYPGQNASLWSDVSFLNSNIVANIKNASNVNLWSANYNFTKSYSGGTSTMLNPTYANFKVKNISHTNGYPYSYTFFGNNNGVYSNQKNNQLTISGTTFHATGGTTQGMNYSSGYGTSISGPGVSKFVGLRAGCSVDCSLSVGLQMCFGGGVGWEIGPATLGCGASCCVTVASVSAQIISMDISASAGYQ